MRLNGTEKEENTAMRPDAWLYLGEIIHRTLNDYMATLAIVRCAMHTVSDQASAQALTDVTVRLQAAAKTYQALRPPQGHHASHLDRELDTLCKTISNSILSSRGIELTLASDPVTVSAYRCWQISLVIFELINNVVRHAFGPEQEGSIAVRARVCNRILQCAIIDDGVCDGVVSPGLGTTIVDALIADLGGIISRKYSSAGSTVAFCVPLADPTFLSRLADGSGLDY